MPKRNSRASFEAADNPSVPQVAKGDVLLDVLYLGRFLAENLLSQRRFHELIEIPIEHAAGVRGRDSGAQILDHLVGLQNVRADLVAPTDIRLRGLLGSRLFL